MLESRILRFISICRGINDISHFLIYTDIVIYDMIFQSIQGYKWYSRQLLGYLPCLMPLSQPTQTYVDP